MSLDEYREQLIARLKSCTNTAAARTLVAEADLVLFNAQLTPLTQGKFWESLDEDLEAAREEARLLADREAGMQFAAVIAVAQARIARYRERLSEARN